MPSPHSPHPSPGWKTVSELGGTAGEKMRRCCVQTTLFCLSLLPSVYKVKCLQAEVPREYGRIKCSLKK